MRDTRCLVVLCCIELFLLWSFLAESFTHILPDIVKSFLTQAQIQVDDARHALPRGVVLHGTVLLWYFLAEIFTHIQSDVVKSGRRVEDEEFCIVDDKRLQHMPGRIIQMTSRKQHASHSVGNECTTAIHPFQWEYGTPSACCLARATTYDIQAS